MSPVGLAGRGAAFLLCLAAGTALGAAPPAERGAGPEISGILEASAAAALAPGYGGTGPSLSEGAEAYSNLRLKARVGERGTVFAALNLAAASGSSLPLDPATGAAAAPFVAGRGYASALELERLYCRVEGEAFDLEAGLLRLAFGFGQAWSPSDFLVSRSPLNPDARPRGSLALAASAYPGGDWKAEAFVVAGGEASAPSGEGTIAGLALEGHGPRGSAQLLYAIEGRAPGPASALHRLGLSLKLEAGAGIVLDALYSLDGDWLRTGRYYDRSWEALDGLEASLGADYSLLKGDLYLMGQYLYRGGSALAPGDGLDKLYSRDASWSDYAPASRAALLDPGLPLGELNRRDYLYAMASYRIDDYDTATLSCAACLDDLSFVPALALEREPFQGLSLRLEGRLPLDASVFSRAGRRGELGPINSGLRCELSARARLKF
jgi:hypothetical protein